MRNGTQCVEAGRGGFIPHTVLILNFDPKEETIIQKLIPAALPGDYVHNLLNIIC
jgi:hypothetical protein